MFEKLTNVLLVALMAAAVGLFVHRNYATAADPRRPAPTYYEDWQELTQLSGSTNPAAEVQIVEFSDYECPFCKDFHDTALPELTKKFDVGFAVVHYPLGGHQNARKAANMAECARAQGKFWQMDSVIFSDVASLSSGPAEYGKIAQVPDIGAWEKCVTEGGGEEAIKAGMKLAAKYKVGGTPTLLINGWQVPNGTAESLTEAIESILQKKKPFRR